jgi:malate dehydrogenase
VEKVAIVGAGQLGASVAARLAARDWAGEIILVGGDDRRAEGKALDLLQSNPVLGSGTRLAAARGLDALAGARWIVIAGPADAGDDGEIRSDLDELFTSAAREARDPVVVIAGNDPAALLGRARDRGLPPRRLIGSAPVALASVCRLHLGRALGCSPRDVAVSIVGAPPAEGLYELFASLGGVPLERLVSANDERRIRRQVSARSRPGAQSLASAAAALLDDMVHERGAVRSCYAWCGGAYGARDLFVCAPAVVGSNGVQRILELELEPGKRVTVDRSLDYLARRSPDHLS